MPALSDIEGTTLLTEGGLSLGKIERVLFHPADPRAVALMVRRERVLGIVTRPPAFVAWADVFCDDGASRSRVARLPSRRSLAETLGCDVDATVIWRGMPVVSASGGRMGTVADAVVSGAGLVERVWVSTGAVGDMAHGRLAVPGETVRGFDGHAVVVDARGEELETGGGLARTAGKGVASVKVAAGGTAKAAGDALVGASHATGRALAAAARSKPARRMRRAAKGIADAFREGLDGQ